MAFSDRMARRRRLSPEPCCSLVPDSSPRFGAGAQRQARRIPESRVPAALQSARGGRMRTGRRGVVLIAAAGAVVAVSALAGARAAQTPAARAAAPYQPPHAADGHANITGVWQAVNTANWDIQDHSARQ